MERIDRDLQNLSLGTVTPGQNTTDLMDDDPTLAERREELRKSLGVSSLDNRFSSLKPWPGTEEAVVLFKTLVWGNPDWRMLLCYGGVGNGKSHLCEATAIELYKQGKFCRVMTFDRMMLALKRCMEPGAPISFEELLNNYSYGVRLIVDDVGGTTWEMEQLEKIIKARYRERLFTILTTNLDLKELPERVVSRFQDPDVGRIVLNSGEDFRRQKARE